MEKVMIKNIATGVQKEVEKNIVADFLGTKEWEIVTKEPKKESKTFDIRKSER